MNRSAIQQAIAAFQRGDLDRAGVLAGEAGGSADADHLLGLINCQRGNFSAGIDHFRKAAEAEPANPSHRLMLCRALIDAGRAAEVLAMPDPPRDARPEALALWHARAEAAQSLADHAMAAVAWDMLCAARPNDWRCWANFGEALAGLERWPEAAEALGRASALNPEPNIRRNQAAALARAGRYEEAADGLRALLDGGERDVGMRLTLARLLADLGRQEEALAELDAAARQATGAGTPGESGLIRVALPDRRDSTVPATAGELLAVRELALLLERTNRMDALRDLLDDGDRLGVPRDRLGYPAAAVALRDGDPVEALRLLELESPDDDPARWYRLMAKIRDSRGEADAAFEAADRMHRSVPEYDRWVARAAAYRRRIHQMAEGLTAEWAGRLHPLEPGSRPSPAFLVGFPRSGTTLLDTFLMGHPSIAVLEELPMLSAAQAALGEMEEIPGRSRQELEQARQAYFDELDRHIAPGFDGLVVDKLPLNMLGLPVIHSLFPDARLIFAQRHPCDVVLSGLMQSFVMNDAMACYLTIEGAADFYDAAMRLWTRAREALPAQVHVSVYEALIAEPEATLRPLLDFLGLDWRGELLDHQATATRRGAISTPSYDQVVQPLSTRPKGRWRRYERQLGPVLPLLLPWAERLGYAD